MNYNIGNETEALAMAAAYPGTEAIVVAAGWLALQRRARRAVI